MDDLAAFLAARYDEAWAVLDASDADNGYHRFLDADKLTENVVSEFADEERCRRDIAAKRAILAEYVSFREESTKGDVGPGLYMGTQVLGDVVRHLGTEFTDHPDYRADWS